MPTVVGDLIMGFRSQATDLPQLYPPPTGTPTAVDGGAASIPAGNYYIVFTILTAWGETTVSPEFLLTLGVGLHSIVVTLPTTLPNGATAFRVYLGTTPGGENQYIQTTGTTVTFTDLISNVVATPPSRNRAWLPDTDGYQLSAQSAFQWLTEAMEQAASICGGVPDITGIPTVNQQMSYVVSGQWNKLTNAFFDGYPVGFPSKNDVFRRTNNPGIVGSLLVNVVADRLIVECYPPANRTSGSTTTTATMTAASTSVTLAASNFVLGFGLASIGSEIVYYDSNASGVLSGLVRGIGGTRPVAHGSGETVQELNLYLAGMSVPRAYVPGDSAITLQLPPGWSPLLQKFMLSKFRSAERNTQEATSLLQEFQQGFDRIASSKQILGPVQINPGIYGGVELFPGGPFGIINQ